MDYPPVSPQVHTTSKLLESQATLVFWLVVNPKTVSTEATIALHDGQNTSGTKRLEIATGYAFHPIFTPPIRFQHGLYVAIDTQVASYTVGYLTEEAIGKLEE